MTNLFQIATGSVIGREHQRLGKNNQDGHYFLSNENYTIALVCDGCGSGLHSEVGAKIGAKLIVETIAQHLKNGLENPNFWKDLCLELLSKIEVFVNILSTETDRKELIYNYFLFTIIGVIITPQKTVIFASGDGVIFINGKQILIEKFENNAPPYFAYGLLNYPELSQFKIYQEIDTKDVKSILIGTDGLDDLILAETRNFPGKNEKVGAISQFWENDNYFKNPDLIRRKLNLINREVIKPNWTDQSLQKEVGLLSDDTTLIVIRNLNN